LGKARFDSKVSVFFSDYLVGKKTQYLCNNFISPFYNVDIGIDQGSALFLILFVLYISPIFHIFKKRANNLKISIFFLSFINDGIFISQEKSFEKTNSHLFYSYNIIFFLLEQSGLIIKYRKTEVFHFSRSQDLFDSPLLDLSHIRSPILYPRYL